MIKTKILAVAIAAFTLFSCNNNGTTNTNTEKNSSATGSGLYFNYTIDGKEMHVDADDISSTYTESSDTSLLIFAGAEGATIVSLAIPYLISKPSTTPSGSGMISKINRGSVALNNYPEKGYVSSSYDGTYPEKTPIIPDAIVITSTEKQGEEATIITGIFNTKTYSDNKETDPKNTDHVIKGKFRIKHKSSDSRLFNPTKTP